MRIFKELRLRRDFSQHSGRCSGSGERTTEERQRRASECLSGTSVNCVSSSLQLSIYLPFSFLFFPPFFLRGGAGLQKEERRLRACARDGLAARLPNWRRGACLAAASRPTEGPAECGTLEG